MTKLNREPIELTITSGTDSSIANLGKQVSQETSANLITPSGLSGTSLGFEVSMDGSAFYPFHNPDDNSAVSVTVDNTSRAYWLEPVKFYGWNYIKIISNASETDKTFQIVTYGV